MNPAALKTNLGDLKSHGILIVNTDEFNERNFKKASYTENPLENKSLDGYRVYEAAITTMTRRALDGMGLDTKTQDRSKNLFALGMVYWLYSRPIETTVKWLEEKFAKRPEIAEANKKALKAGWNFCDITQIFQERYEVLPAALEAGTYRNIHGNSALSLGLVAASRRSGLPLFIGAYRSLRPATSSTSSRLTNSSE